MYVIFRIMTIYLKGINAKSVHMVSLNYKLLIEA
jgi:hypothetical protein